MANFIFKEKLFSGQWFRHYSLVILGAFIMAAGYTFFITPHKIVPGGVFGIAIVLYHKLGINVGFAALAFNIPLTIIGTKILGPRFGMKTILGFVMTSFFIELITYFTKGQPLVDAGDTLLSCIFGGLLIGIGVGFIFKAKATVGGSDVMAMIGSKYTKIPLGQMMIIIDSVIVLISLVAFGDWRIPLYSWITIYVMGKTIDIVLDGMSYDKSVFIISDKHEQISDKIINNIHRGGTFFQGKGMYSGSEKNVIFTVASRREVAMLQEYIREIDPNSFMVVNDASEIIGKGFKSLNEKLEN